MRIGERSYETAHGSVYSTSSTYVISWRISAFLFTVQFQQSRPSSTSSRPSGVRGVFPRSTSSLLVYRSATIWTLLVHQHRYPSPREAIACPEQDVKEIVRRHLSMSRTRSLNSPPLPYYLRNDRLEPTDLYVMHSCPWNLPAEWMDLTSRTFTVPTAKRTPATRPQF